MNKYFTRGEIEMVKEISVIIKEKQIKIEMK